MVEEEAPPVGTGNDSTQMHVHTSDQRTNEAGVARVAVRTIPDAGKNLRTLGRRSRTIADHTQNQSRIYVTHTIMPDGSTN